MRLLFAQAFHDEVLGEVRILVLVDQHIAEGILVACQYLRMVAEKDIRLEQQIVEIHGAGLEAAVLVPFVNLPQLRHFAPDIALDKFFVLLVSPPGNQRVFRIRDAALHHARAIGLIVELHFFDNRADEVLRVGRIVYREVGRKPDGRCFPA